MPPGPTLEILLRAARAAFADCNVVAGRSDFVSLDAANIAYNLVRLTAGDDVAERPELCWVPRAQCRISHRRLAYEG